MTNKEHIKRLVGALVETLPYLPNCDIKKGEGDDCGPKIPYTPRCPYMKARAAIEGAGGKVP